MRPKARGRGRFVLRDNRSTKSNECRRHNAELDISTLMKHYRICAAYRASDLIHGSNYRNTMIVCELQTGLYQQRSDYTRATSTAFAIRTNTRPTGPPYSLTACIRTNTLSKRCIAVEQTFRQICEAFPLEMYKR